MKSDKKIEKISIDELLSNKKTYVVPRYQRTYSWKKNNVKLFINDLFNNINIFENKLMPNNYFIGIMIFTGNFEQKGIGQIYIVDGQQRLTTIVMILSIIAKKLRHIGEEKEAERTFKYVQSKYKKESYITLDKDSNSSFFYDAIQSFDDSSKSSAKNEEDKNIKERYTEIEKQLDEKSVLKRFNNGFEYRDILIKLREQILKCYIFAIQTETSLEANAYFETLNGKGLDLLSVDLVKNTIFEKCLENPKDIAKIKWRELTETLYINSNETVDLQTFFRHYWNSKYSKETDKSLFGRFRKTINKSSDDYMAFLSDMLVNAKRYMKISYPDMSQFRNKGDYKLIVQYLKSFYAFNVILYRMPMMALFEAHENKKIKIHNLNKIIEFLELFHFEFNAVSNKTNNIVDNIYSSYSIKIRKCTDSKQLLKITNEDLFTKLYEILPKKDEFINGFIELKYDGKENENRFSRKTSYAIKKLNSFYNHRKDYVGNESVEHIINKKHGEFTYNVGNLICLEDYINKNIPENIEKLEDKIDYYNESKYPWIKAFTKEYMKFEKDNIEERAKRMAEFFYDEANKVLLFRFKL